MALGNQGEANTGRHDFPESPIVRYYDQDPRLARSLQTQITKEIAEKSGHVASGLAEDWGDYKERCGFIAGLKRAIEIANEAEKKLKE